jgi:hypothetical protein
MKSYAYKVVRFNSTFSPFGFNNDVILSRHKTYESAVKAFNSVLGACKLTTCDNKLIDSKLT